MSIYILTETMSKANKQTREKSLILFPVVAAAITLYEDVFFASYMEE